jgi:hypothetical protein
LIPLARSSSKETESKDPEGITFSEEPYDDNVYLNELQTK